MARSSSWDEAAASNLLGLFIILATVALVLTLWATVKTFQLLVRVFANHPRNPVLLTTIIATGVLLVVVLATSAQLSAIDVSAAISGGLLLLTAAVLDVADDTRLRRPMSRDTAVHAVLHEWWPAA